MICSKNEPVPLFSQLNMGVQIEALKNELNELVKTSKEKSEKS